jgi:hypothetical protein
MCRVIVTFYMPCVYCMSLYSAKIYEILHAIVWTLNVYLSISICVYCMSLYSAKIYEILHAIVWTLNVYLSISICVYDRYV